LEKGNLSEQKKILAGKNSLSKKGYPYNNKISQRRNHFLIILQLKKHVPGRLNRLVPKGTQRLV
jgi:hypothetical protein